jgi:predicted aconitase with swiveling domain
VIPSNWLWVAADVNGRSPKLTLMPKAKGTTVISLLLKDMWNQMSTATFDVVVNSTPAVLTACLMSYSSLPGSSSIWPFFAPR